MALSQAMQKRIAQTTANKIAGSTPAVTAPNVNPQDSSDWMRDRIRQSVSQKMDNTQYGYNPFEKYTVSSRNSYITNFLNDADSFFRTVDSDINGENRFNAADFFAQRQKQAESLKRSADIASQYLDQYGDTFDEKDYDFLRNYLSTFNTNVDEVMGYYQPSMDARSGMAAYEDEYRAYQEEQAKKGQRLQIAAGILGNDPSASGIFAPAAGFLNMLGDAVTGADPRGITDKWTDQQKYYLGTLQNEDPGEARRYARSVNLGEDPLQAAVNAEQEEQRMLGEDLGALQAEIDRLNAQYDNYQYDASTFRGRMAADADLRRMEKEISDKEQYYRQVKRIQDSAAMAAVSGNQDYAEKNGYVSTARAGISTEGNPMGVYSDMLYEYINGNQSVRDHVAATNKALANKGYDLMTEEEVGNYNYFYATEGKEKAEAYLDSLDEKLSQRKGEEIFQRLEGNTAREMMFGVGSGLNQFGANLENLMNFQDDYLAPSAYQVAAGMVREDLDEVGPRLPEFLGGGSLGQVGFDLINTSANMAPSIMVSMGLGMLNPAVGKIAGTALMGGSAAGGAYQEALNSGYSKEQARMYSALVGGSEAGMEYLIGGISKLGGRLPEAAMEKILKGVDNAFARAAIELGGSMASEGFEEGLQEVLTPYFKNLTLMADERVDWNEVAYSALLGALSALPMEGPGAVRNAISGSKRMRGGMEEGRVPEAVYSNTGMARQISMDADVDVLDFDSVGNGNATIQLKDGGTADYRDIMFANEQQANQFRAVVSLPGIDTDSANNALHAVMDADAGADVDSLIGIRDAYGKGYGVAQESDLAKGDSANINPQLRKTLFDIGRAQRDAQAAIPTQRSIPQSPPKAATAPFRQGGQYKRVVLEGKDTKIKPGTKQDAEVRFMDYIAENFSGTTVHVYKSKKGRDGKFYYWDSEGKRRRAPNGKYSGGEIWVDLNAGDKGEGLVLNTFAHEMYHHIKENSAQKANELGEFIVKELGLESAEKAVAEQIKKARKAGRSESYFEKFEGMTPEQARNKVEQDAWEDFIADSLETVFTRGDAAKAIADLKSENRGLFDEIKKFVDKWVSKLKEFYSDKTISQEGEMVAQLESFEKIQKLFMEAMEDAGKNFSAAEVTDEKSTTLEGDVKYQARNPDSFTDAEIHKIQSIGRKSINSFTSQDLQAVEKFAKQYSKEMGTKSPFFRAWFGDWRANETTPIAIAKQIDNTRGVKINEDTGWEINISGQVFNETSKHRSKSNREAVAFLPYINDIVQKAVLLDSYGIDSNKPKSPNSLLMHSLYAVADIGYGPEVLKLYVEEMNNPAGSDTNKRAYELQNIEKAFNASVRVQGNAPSSLTNTQNAIKNVADLVAAVKRYDANYVPVESSKIRNVDGTPKVMYHGSPAQFSRFDRKKAKSSGLYGRGFYFTDSDTHAKTYGNTYSVYLNIRNPLQSGTSSVSRDQVRSFLEAVAENEDYSIENYGTYDIDNILKTVMDGKSKVDAFKVIQDISATAVGDMVEATELFNQINGTTFDGIVVPTETVAFQPEQIKSATDNIGTFDPQNDDIYYSLRNEEVDNSPQGILMRMDVKSRKLDAEKYHLSRYQERVEKLDKDEARLADVKAEIQQLSANEKQNRKGLTQLRNEERNLNTSIKGLKRDIKFAEQTDMFKKMVSDGRLLEYRAEQREAEKARILEYRALRKEITGMDSVMSVMEDEFVRLARDYEAQKIDLKTMEAEFLRLSKEYDKVERVAGDTKTLKADNAIWQREYRRLMREYEATDRKAKELEQKLTRQRNLATERVQSRQKTDLRHKIQRQADSLNKLLLKPDKKKHILEPLQGSVAAILDAINMEVRNTEQRARTYASNLARYDRLIAAETDPAKISDLIAKRAKYEDKGDQFAGKMLALKEAYKNIRDNADQEAQGVYDDGLSDYLDEMVRKVGDTPLGKMTKEQLELVHDTLTAVQTVVSNANKAFDETRKQGITDMSHQAIVEVHNAGSSRKESTETAENIRKFGFNNMKPIYALETIGSKVMTGLFGNVRKGEDTWARNISESKNFFQRVSEKHGLKDWDMEKEYSFTASSGLDFKLNVEQIMSLYAYAKRDQARDHLRKGGIVFDPNSEKTVRNKLGLKKKLVSTDATAYNIDDVTLGEIISKLTPEQKAFVDEMQRYLSDTMGAKGNEVSMKLYGIKLFKEANYFPLHSSGAYNARVEAQGKDGEVKLKNASFTRAVTPNASNPIVLTPFLSTWAGHVDEMSMYNAFTLPLEDFYRVLNYSTANVEGNASQSVRAAIQNAYGKAAVDYLDQLLKDLNGGARSDNTAGFVNKALSLYKKGATMASFSVVIQQPSAVVRAAAMIPHKYFIGPKVTEQSHNKTWAEMKQYAPICTIKEMGYFDTSVGKSTRDYLTGQEYNGFQEKAMALLTDSSYRDEALGKLPALADEFGWAMIWNAVKREQYDLHPNMKANDPKFLNMVAERFTDVIVHTQVYDSVLSRSANMRSKDNLMKMATAFMAEPTTTINMVSNAILQAKRGGDKRQAARTIGAAAGSLILNSMLVATVYAMRDDDEDKRLGEKYIKSLTENLVNSFNPLTYIPFLRDFNSLFQGYSVERADMAIANDLVQAWRGLSDEDKTPWEKVETFTGAVFQAFGIPVKNIMRDVKAVWNTVNTIANAEAATSTGRMVAIKEALPFGKKANDGEQMLMAIRSGDQDHIQRVFGRFENQQKAESALQSAIREEYLAGKITAEEATQLLTDNFDREDESEVYWILDEWDYARNNDTSEGYTKMGMLMDAVESGENLDAEIQRYLDNGMDASDIKSQISKVYRKRYLEADEETRTQINDTVRNAYLKLGEQDDDIDSRMNEWDFEAKYGMTYADMKTDYRNGEISERDLRDAMKFYGMRNFEIDKNIRSLNEDIAFFERFGMSLSELKDGYDDGDVSRNTLISALEFTGKTRTQAQEEVRERDIGNRLGIDYMNLDDAYKWGDISRQTFYNAMIENGATRQEADEAIAGYDWLKKNAKRYPDLTISDAKKFAVKISSDLPDVTLNDYGVSIDSYIEYTKRRPECMGVDANGDGKTDSGTLRDSVFRMIDSLPISDKAKDGLALMSYSMNSIKKNAPWH